jgi:hypothetical protein
LIAHHVQFDDGLQSDGSNKNKEKKWLLTGVNRWCPKKRSP